MGDKALRGNKLTIKDIEEFYEEKKKKKRIIQPPIKAGKGPIPGGGFAPIGKPIAFKKGGKVK